MAGALPAAARLPAPPGPPADRGYASARAGLSQLITWGCSLHCRGPLLTLLPNDVLLREIICCEAKPVSPEKSLENSGTPGLKHSCAAQWPHCKTGGCGVCVSLQPRAPGAARPATPAPQPSRKPNHSLDLRRGGSEGVGTRVIS